MQTLLILGRMYSTVTQAASKGAPCLHGWCQWERCERHGRFARARGTDAGECTAPRGRQREGGPAACGEHDRGQGAIVLKLICRHLCRQGGRKVATWRDELPTPRCYLGPDLPATLCRWSRSAHAP